MSDSDDDCVAAPIDETWDDWGAEVGAEGEDQAQSLFDNSMHNTVAAALEHDATKHGFDVVAFTKQRRLDEYGIIRCINYIRSEVAAGRDPRPTLASAAEAPPWADDAFLRPVLPDDALLMHDFDEGDQANDAEPMDASTSQPTAFDEVSRLREQNQALREALASATLAPLLQDVRMDGDAERDVMSEAAQQHTAASFPAGPSTSAATPAQEAPGPTKARGQKHVSFAMALAAEAGRVDDSYFDSYSYLDIHREMLSDKARTEAYRDALEKNPALLRGARVLDVGCGTGILSMFAARAGAASVVGVDGSKRIADFARQVATQNNLAAEVGGPVSIVTGKIEDLHELPGGPDAQQVHVLVSEWMGYALLFESMLDSVLAARDRFLPPGGAMLPDMASLYVAGGGAGAGGLAFWSDVYGFDMSPIADALHAASLSDAVVAAVKAEDLVTPPTQIKTLDLATMNAQDADFTADFRVSPTEECSSAAAECHSLVLWFDVEFSKRFCTEHPVRLDTSPHAPQTHWVQVILGFREPILLRSAAQAGKKTAAGSTAAPLTCTAAVAIAGRISMARAKKHRSLDISVEYAAEFADGSRGATQTRIYDLSVSGGTS